MDAWSLRHLNAWLELYLNEDAECLLAVRTAMLAHAADDPAYWQAQGWRKLYDAAQGDKVVRKHKGLK